MKYISLLFFITLGTLISANGAMESHNLDYEKQWDFNSFNSIDLNIITGNIRITPTVTDKMVLKIYGTVPFKTLEEFIKVEDSNGLLKVNQYKKATKSLRKYKLDADLYIPQERFNMISVKLVTGNIFISSKLDSEKFRGKITTGNMVLHNLQSNKSQINITTGDLEIKEFSGDLKANIITGQIGVNTSDFSSEVVDLKLITGKLKLNLPPKSSFNLDSSVVSGGIIYDLLLTENQVKSKKSLIGLVNQKPTGSVKLSVTTGKIYINQQ